MPGLLAAHRSSRPYLAIDERGVGLRARWRTDQGFVNISLWRDNVCVGTFHAGPATCADLIAVLAAGLAEAASPDPVAEQGTPGRRSGDDPPAGATSGRHTALRLGIARSLAATAARLERP